MASSPAHQGGARRGRALLIWAAIDAALAGGVWTVGAFWTPRPETLAVLLVAIFFGGLLVFGWAAWNFRKKTPVNGFVISGALGLGAAVAIACFCFQVLSNFEGELTPMNGALAAAKPLDRLRIVNLNVLHGYPDFRDHEARFADTAAALRSLGPDVLILQEAWHTQRHGNMAEHLARSLGFHWVYARANGSRRLIGFEEGVAVVSRVPIRNARRLLLAPRRPWWENRIALVANLDLGPERLTVVGVHLGYRDAETTDAQARSLLTRLAPESFLLVAGDLNAESGSPAVGRFTDADLIDVLPGGIDHCFVPRSLHDHGWQVAAAAWTLRAEDLVGLIGKKTEISDHPGIVVDLVRVRKAP